MFRRLGLGLALLLSVTFWSAPGATRELTVEEIQGWIRHISRIQQARREAPNDPSLLLSLAEAYGRLGDVARAVRTARRARDAGATRLASVSVEADTYLRWGHPGEAIPLYLTLLEDAPLQTYVLVQLWKATIEEVTAGRADRPDTLEAIERLNAAGLFVPPSLEPTPEAALDAARLAQEAAVLFAQRRLSDAVTRAQQSLSQDPGHLAAFAVLFRAYSRMGEDDRALGSATVYSEFATPGPLREEAHRIILDYYRARSRN